MCIRDRLVVGHNKTPSIVLKKLYDHPFVYTETHGMYRYFFVNILPDFSTHVGNLHLIFSHFPLFFGI